MEEAEQLFRAVWKLDERILGPTHPDTRMAIISLVNVLRSLERFDDTRELVQRKLDYLRASADKDNASPQALDKYARELMTV